MRIRIRHVIDDSAVYLGRDAAGNLEDANLEIAIITFVRQAGIGGQHVRARILAHTVAISLTIFNRTFSFVSAPGHLKASE